MGVSREQLNTALEQRLESRREKVRVLYGQEVAYVDVSVFPFAVKGMEGAVIRIDDVSDRVRMESMMVQTEKMMSVGGLAAGMAHEINNPLGSILQGTQNIQRRLSSELEQNTVVAKDCGIKLESVQEYLDRRCIFKILQEIRNNGERAAEIVANMLRFSRNGGTTKEQHNFAQLINRAIVLARHDYNLKKNYNFRQISIIRDYPETLQVNCMSTEIEQVILNLLKNAAQAMMAEPHAASRQPKIQISAQQEGAWIVLRITDNGPGMDKKIAKRIFEPFFTTKEVGEGTGLGLSVSYFIIVHNHSGRIEIDSLPDRGSVFTISLPV